MNKKLKVAAPIALGLALLALPLALVPPDRSIAAVVPSAPERANVAASWPVGPQPAPTRTTTSPTPPAPTIVALSVGDSLTAGILGSPGGNSYRSELSRLMDMTGQPHSWRVAGVGGSKCSYWVTQIDALITQYDPDVIFLNCGTNDTPTDNTEADYRSILNTAAARGVPVVASYIMIPDMRSPTNVVRPWIIDWMHSTNLAIEAALADYPNVPVADMQRVPPNPEWLYTDGIHLTARSEAAWGQLFYQAAQPMMGWRTLAQMGTYEMCGLSGAWITEPWPTPDVAYRVCRN